jgi:hypothetical protein
MRLLRLITFNFEMFDGEYPTVPLTFRPLETYIAEHEVGLTLQPVLFGLHGSFVSGLLASMFSTPCELL